MSILSRYLLKLHLGPFLFALGAWTGFLLINQVARRFSDLAGKGLPWSVITEVFLLSIPFIVAMTLPMAVLIAVLYAVSRLAGDAEVTAMRAGGISLGRIMRPLLVSGSILAILAFLFSDHVLPRSNHRLRTLYTDIGQKKPTFSIKEQVINEIRRNQLFLRAASIDPATYLLRDVTIYDLTDQERKRIIYADSGYLAITANQEDAQLTLFDGTMHEFDRSDPRMFQHVGFARDVILVEGVGNELKRTLTDTYKGDREMGICEMEEQVRTARREQHLSRVRADAVRRNGLRSLVGLATIEADTTAAETRPSMYCRALRQRAAWLLPEQLRAEQPPRQEQVPARRVPSVTGRRFTSARPRAATTPPPIRAAELRAFEDRARQAAIRSSHFLVEVHKKYTIAAACLVFVVLGVPVALRFPHGGVGAVIGWSLGIFGIYYVGLIGGETLADRLIVPAAFLWAPNILFTVVGTWMLYRTRAEMAPKHGGLRALLRGGRAS
ncbi:MAG TPA: LptF/LptG family permease [Gemmatimonadales bacterium]